MAISHWPAEQRPREKLLRDGAQSLSDAELLAIFLRTGTSGISAVELAQQLLQRYGGLRSLLTANKESFCQTKGLGPAKFSQLQAVLEMARRHLAEQLQRGDSITSARQAEKFLISQLRDRHREVFACLLLDNQHRVIRYQELFFGTIDCASVHPREVLLTVLKHHAAAVIFAHNHPSGNPNPSTADRQITDCLQKALALIEVRVLDHLVIGDGKAESLAELGWLSTSS